MPGPARITDFGIAVAGGAGMAAGRAGTPGYMAPEQAAGATILDTVCDVWAFGVVMFEMLSGSRAFPQGTTNIVAGENLSAGGVDWTRLPTTAPRALRDLLERCLVADPARRLSDVGWARSVLESLRTPPAHEGLADRSVLVLPIVNLSADPDNEYFSDGLTEDVIEDLSRIEAMRVISRTTAMRFKGVAVDLAAVGRELNVRYVLEGSVRKAGADLRISAQLVDTRVDRTLWSEKYRGTLDNVFEIQERVSRAIATTLRLHLTADEDRRLAFRRTASGFVYDLYLRTRRDILSFDKTRLDRAREELEHAQALVGDEALIFTGLGMAYWQLVNAGFSTDSALLDKAEACAKKVTELDPAGPHGPAILAHLAATRGSILEWVRQGERALAAEPRDPDSLVWLAMGWTWAGHPDAARPIFARLETIDPLFDYLYFGLAFLEQCEGRIDRALDRIRRARALQPDMVAWPLTEIQLLLQTGRTADAAHMVATVLPPVGTHPLADMTRSLVHASQGDRQGALASATHGARPQAVGANGPGSLEAVSSTRISHDSTKS